jgi:hypothetical protein
MNHHRNGITSLFAAFNIAGGGRDRPDATSCRATHAVRHAFAAVIGVQAAAPHSARHTHTKSLHRNDLGRSQSHQGLRHVPGTDTPKINQPVTYNP